MKTTVKFAACFALQKPYARAFQRKSLQLIKLPQSPFPCEACFYVSLLDLS